MLGRTLVSRLKFMLWPWLFSVCVSVGAIISLFEVWLLMMMKLPFVLRTPMKGRFERSRWLTVVSHVVCWARVSGLRPLVRFSFGVRATGGFAPGLQSSRQSNRSPTSGL